MIRTLCDRCAKDMTRDVAHKSGEVYKDEDSVWGVAAHGYKAIRMKDDGTWLPCDMCDDCIYEVMTAHLCREERERESRCEESTHSSS